jgi:ABC-type tungstate transport system substrate-binding protein
MKAEFVLLTLVGMSILAYVLDAVVNPLHLPLATPYEFFHPAAFSLYPFSIISIALKALVIAIGVPWVLSFTGIHHLVRAGITLVILGLLQLYAVQDVATGANILSQEWALGLTLGGMLLIVPLIIHLILGMFQSVNKKLEKSLYGEPPPPKE